MLDLLTGCSTIEFVTQKMCNTFSYTNERDVDITIKKYVTISDSMPGSIKMCTGLAFCFKTLWICFTENTKHYQLGVPQCP